VDEQKGEECGDRRGGRKPKEIREEPTAKMQRHFTAPESMATHPLDGVHQKTVRTNCSPRASLSIISNF